MAQLASEGKFFVVRYRIRTGKVTNATKEFNRDLYDNKTALSWLTAIVDGSHKIECGQDRNDSMPFLYRPNCLPKFITNTSVISKR